MNQTRVKRGKIQPIKLFFNEVLGGRYSLKRLIFKTAVLVTCGIGCAYQVGTFLQMYFKYPSTFDLEITYPDKILFPAITVCNINSFRRTLYCQLDPELCRLTKRGEDICQEDEEKCKNITFMSLYMLPNPEELEEEILVRNVQNLLKYTNGSIKLLRSCYASWAPNDPLCREDRLLKFSSYSFFEVLPMCHTINSQLNRPAYPSSYIPTATQDEGNYLRIILDLEPHEYFQGKRPVEGYVYLHNPFFVDSPYVYASVVKPGYSYNIHIEVSLTKLLPAPFPTNCANYAKRREENGGVGPLNQVMCMKECIIAITRETCNCFPIFLPTPIDDIGLEEKFCERTLDPEACESRVDISSCRARCGTDCEMVKYETKTFENIYQNPPENDFNDPLFNTSSLGVERDEVESYYIPYKIFSPIYENLFLKDRFVELIIRLKKPELVVYTQKAKFETIELFGYVGSYIGMWLGLCLIAINDLIELGIVLILKKKKK